MHGNIPSVRSAAGKLVVAVCLMAFQSGAFADSSCCDPEIKAFSGTAAETIDAAGYTYILVDTGKKKLWAATPKLTVARGDKVAITNAMAMPNYESKTLKRKFDVVYFTGTVFVNGKNQNLEATSTGARELPPGHPKIDAQGTGSSSSDFSTITTPSGGKTVSEIVDQAKQLRGKEVTVRGKVMKYNSGVLGRNWLHIRDGSGVPGNNDLTVTTETPARVGATVLVKGKVSTDRNFGSGYFYPVIVEDAHLTVE